jgi:methenyltetrahydrofolate cyclohydrolase
MYINKPIKEYIEELAAKKPAPGGGSAASLAGVLGSALLEMVCNFTLGNKKYKGIEADVSDCLASVKKIREEFIFLVDEDARIYSSMSEAFKTKNEKIIDNALKEGYYISLKICELAKSGMVIALQVSEKSNVSLITDVGCGAELLKASFNSGAFNAEINLKSIKDELFIEKEKAVLNNYKIAIADIYKKVVSKTIERMA